MSKTYYITTTLPYVNADPHIGFALEIIQADIIARWQRLQGKEVVFNTGTDEHGQKIQDAAAKAGMDPKAYCDQFAAKLVAKITTPSNSSNSFKSTFTTVFASR